MMAALYLEQFKITDYLSKTSLLELLLRKARPSVSVNYLHVFNTWTCVCITASTPSSFSTHVACERRSSWLARTCFCNSLSKRVIPTKIPNNYFQNYYIIYTHRNTDINYAMRKQCLFLTTFLPDASPFKGVSRGSALKLKRSIRVSHKKTVKLFSKRAISMHKMWRVT